jgi:uracil-DNA glycosylase family 4
MATQTVFGAASDHPLIVLIGEQPGLQEDATGLPFVSEIPKRTVMRNNWVCCCRSSAPHTDQNALTALSADFAVA